jgi:hypothetical protein
MWQRAGLLAGAAILVGACSVDVGAGTAASSPSVTPGARPLPVGQSDLAPGRYVTDEQFPVRITFEVPDGWFAWISNAQIAGVVVNNGIGDGASGWGVTFWIVDNVYSDQCDPGSKVDPPVGPTVDDLVTALSSLPGYRATAPVDAIVSGFPGVEFELTAPEYGEECLQHRTWSTPSDEPRVMLPGETNRLQILNVDDVRVVVAIVEYAHTTEFEQLRGIPLDPNAHAADQPELRQILESIRIESWS